ncbi:MarP family serine protease [Cryobacterium sp. TMT1-2-1]|uniref:MarP family serine protease n=1 Tax=Cryobacterium sp. TMT1-2-1 TaxID=1259232 RepID=UPI00106BC7C4|nr:MarP family serine protease [Cryobacterium sp. TMT1-2-1]TFD44793.1 MarP family serine protease [Cryobacterium sp. TMT1-2-1]
MQDPILLDVLLVLVLVASLVNGYRSGLVRSLSGIAGIVAGGTVAFFLVPLIGPWIQAPEWRTPVTLGAALVLVLGGFTVGESIGHAIRRRAHRTRLRVVDRVLGAGVALVATALVISMLAFSIGALGVPFLSPAIASSGTVRTINELTPDPVERFLAQLRSSAVEDGLPRIVEAFTGPSPDIPTVDTGSPALVTAARSVLKITGNAYACGQNQSGSGFVVAAGRVVTNAHVVAGVSEPVVEVPGGGALPGRVVYFDPVDDLAVIAVSGLTAAPLQLTGNLAPGTEAVTDGYPLGGPFDSDPAEVISVASVGVADIYGQNPSPRQVYTLASDVQQGESGGPLLSLGGEVAGVIFAKAEDTPNVGYALAMEELAPVAARAASLSSPVASGHCVND